MNFFDLLFVDNEVANFDTHQPVSLWPVFQRVVLKLHLQPPTMEEMTAEAMIMNAPSKPRRSSEFSLALRRRSQGEMNGDFEMRGVVEASKKLQFSDDPEFEEEYALPKLSKPTFDLSPNEQEERLEGFRLDASWEEEERGKEEEEKQELRFNRNVLLDAPRKGKHSAETRFALRKQLQEEALLEEDNFYRKRKFNFALGEGEEDHCCGKRKFTLEEEDDDGDDEEERFELKVLPLKKRVRFNLSSLCRKNLEEFVNEKRMEELENRMKQL